MASDLYDGILAADLSILQGLSLTDLDTANIIARHLPKASETLDNLPLVVLALADDPEDIQPLSFEDGSAYRVIYSADIVVIADSNHDFASNRKKYLRWREQIRRAFQTQQLDGVPEVYQQRIRPFAPVDRNLLNQNYWYSGLTVKHWAVEQRTD